MSSMCVSDEVFDGFVLLPDFSQSRRAPTISTILILCTGILIADPLCAGDEKLVLLLPPDSPSPPDYSHPVCVCVRVHMHHLVQLCRQHISLTGCKVSRKSQYSFVFSILCHIILNVVQIVKGARVWYSMATR